MSTIDKDTYERLVAIREAQDKGVKAPQSKAHVRSTPAEPTPEELFLSAKPELTGLPNQTLFSTLFWKPKTVPDFYVPHYEDEYWPEQVRDCIPEIDESYYLDRTTVEAVMYSLSSEGTTLLHGPTGTGKTSVIKELAARCRIPFFRVSCHGQMEASEFLGGNSVVNEGGVSVTKHSDTDTTLAVKHGGILLLDEVFRTPSTALMSLQALLEQPHVLNLQDSHGNARQLKAPERDFFFLLTDNTTGVGDTTGNYTAEVQDTATRNRIRRAIFMPYLDKKKEIELLNGVNPQVPESFHRMMVEVANLMRTSFTSNAILETMSIRELVTWSNDLLKLRDLQLAFKLGVYSRLTEEDKPTVADMYRQVIGVTLK